MNIVELVGSLSFPILERIPIFGDFAISPHGIGIAVGFALGAVVMIRLAQKRGLGHAYEANISEAVQELLTRSALGAILGARFFYVLTHLDQFADDPIRALYAWEGGLTFLGGVAGAVLLAVPFARSRGWSMVMLLDSAAPGIALGLAVGRIGDLMIGDHIGAPTNFPLGWKCTANYWTRATNEFGRVAPLPYPTGGGQPTAGCFDVAVHHTALYDFGATVIVLAVLVLMQRRRWFDGAFIAGWVFVYGALRFTSDFTRNDRTWAGLTGSQWSLLAATLVVGAALAATKPWRRSRWAWDLAFDHPWLVDTFDPDAFSIQEGPLVVGTGDRSRGAHTVLSAAAVGSATAPVRRAAPATTEPSAELPVELSVEPSVEAPESADLTSWLDASESSADDVPASEAVASEQSPSDAGARAGGSPGAGPSANDSVSDTASPEPMALQPPPDGFGRPKPSDPNRGPRMSSKSNHRPSGG
ncbi:MAG: phosphatidylglycerol:prolipoprotein diacylglycerol transferase [Glaciecola sp.]|jgi:phosphatidylglycerol:prolipoprotein diacylglycerol transferase